MAKICTDEDPILRYDAVELAPEDRAQARKNIGVASAEATPEMYFDITDDGIISLKPEYRGKGNSTYPYSVSDNGANTNGSKISELPKDIIIPDVVNEIAVTALAEGMFYFHFEVVSVTIPECITEIPACFCYCPIALKTVKGTENVKVLGDLAFTSSGIEKIYLPALERVDGASHFENCFYLTVADLGNKITAIPDGMFMYNERLSYLRNGEKITSIGKSAFMAAKRLLNPTFISGLIEIGDWGFAASRVNYDWASLTGCTFGSEATPLEYTNNTEDWWSGCTPKVCKTPMRSTFNQNNPMWKDEKIGNSDVTYVTGCLIICAAMIYSAYEEKDLASPQEFEDVLKAIDSSLMDLAPNQFDSAVSYLEAVGYSVESKTYNATTLQEMYDALSEGALVLARVSNNGADMGHAVVVHGVNTLGEALVTDSDGCTWQFGDYQALTYPMPIQNMATKDDYFMIVRKN